MDNKWRPAQVLEEIKQLYAIAFPMILTGLITYGKSVISMIFMGNLGKEVLAGGSLSIGFANITGYSILSGLSMGMEAISSQAYGAKQYLLMSHSMHRTIFILLSATLPISFLWLNVEPVLLHSKQNPTIASIAATHLAYSLPNLVIQSILYPLTIYLRSQNITQPLLHSAVFSLVFHIPLNYLFTCHFNLDISGIAIVTSLSNLNYLISILVCLYFSQGYTKCWLGFSVMECFREWKPILLLAIPSCISICLEWWWYEFMIIFSGLLTNATDAVATMGILIQTTSLVYIFPSSLSLAVSTRVGNELGASQPDRARVSTQVALVCAVLTGFLAMVFTMTLRDSWARVFTKDEAIVTLTALAMPVVGLCELGNCPQTTGCGVLRGSARPSLGANINLGCFYGVGLPIAVFLGFVMDMGLLGLWLGLLAAQGACALVMMFALLGTDWDLEANRARQLTSCNYNVAEREVEAEQKSESLLLEGSQNVLFVV